MPGALSGWTPGRGARCGVQTGGHAGPSAEQSVELACDWRGVAVRRHARDRPRAEPSISKGRHPRPHFTHDMTLSRRAALETASDDPLQDVDSYC